MKLMLLYQLINILFKSLNLITMKKIILLTIMFFAVLFSIAAQVTDSTATVTYNFGDSLVEFLKGNMWTLIFAVLYFVSEWIGETDSIPEGSIWRKLLNWALAFAKKKGTLSSKMRKFTKILILGFILSCVGMSANAQKHHILRVYPFKTMQTQNLKDVRSTNIDSTIFFGASVGFDVFLKEQKSGDYSIGAIPGVGYGFKWDPKWNPVKKTASLLSLDIFTEAKLDKEILDTEIPTTAKYFNIRILPMVGLFDWVHIGYGPLFKIGVNGNDGYTDWMFGVSISKTL